MNIIIGILILVLGGVIGAVLDVTMKVKEPPVFWFLGTITGAVATLALIN